MYLIDSLKEYEKEGIYNRYDKHHINNIKSIIDLDELQKAVDNKLSELNGQREQSIDRWKDIPEETKKEIEKVEDREELARRIQGDNPLIKVRVR